MAIKLAGSLLNKLKNAPVAQRFLAAGGKDIVKGSIPGAVATSVMSTVTTGNPLAGALVGVTDLGTSALLARGLGSRALNQALVKRADKYPIAGKIASALPGTFITDANTGNQFYQMSIPQGIATAVGSVGSAITLEPYFYPRPQAEVLAQQYPQLQGDIY